MSYDTEEQQVERLKEWWSENGTPIVVGAVLSIAGFSGWKFWNEQQVAYQKSASDAYIKVTDILNTEEKAGLKESAQAVKSEYPDSSYAILATLHLAKLAVDANDLDNAAAELTWIIDNHSSSELVGIAQIRLARIFVSQDKAADALALVNVDEASGYYALANLIKGDALVMMNKPTEALSAYKIASADVNFVARNPSLQIKIDQLTQEQPQTPVAVEEKQ